MERGGRRRKRADRDSARWRETERDRKRIRRGENAVRPHLPLRLSPPTSAPFLLLRTLPISPRPFPSLSISFRLFTSLPISRRLFPSLSISANLCPSPSASFHLFPSLYISSNLSSPLPVTFHLSPSPAIPSQPFSSATASLRLSLSLSSFSVVVFRYFLLPSHTISSHLLPSVSVSSSCFCLSSPSFSCYILLAAAIPFLSITLPYPSLSIVPSLVASFWLFPTLPISYILYRLSPSISDALPNPFSSFTISAWRFLPFPGTFTLDFTHMSYLLEMNQQRQS